MKYLRLNPLVDRNIQMHICAAPLRQLARGIEANADNVAPILPQKLRDWAKRIHGVADILSAGPAGVAMCQLWRPIAELPDKYSNGLLLCAPELVDLDCNEAGIGMGYWQDDRDVPCGPDGAIREEGVDYGGFLACKWNMTNDEWYEVSVTPTHFIEMQGPTP